MAEGTSRDGAFHLRSVPALGRKYWIVLGITTVLGLGLGVAISAQQAPVYQAEAIVGLTPVLSVGASGGTVGEAELQTDLELLSSADATAAVTKVIGNIGSAQFDVAADQTSNIRITGVADTPAHAAQIANAYATYLQELVKSSDLKTNATTVAVVQARLDDVNRKLVAKGIDPTRAVLSPRPEIVQLATQQQTYEQQLVTLADTAQFMKAGRAALLNPATAPSASLPSSIKRSGLVGALLGFLVGVAIVALREYLDDSVKGPDDFNAATHGLAVLGSVPVDREWGKDVDTRLAVLVAPNSGIAESYRTIRTALQYVRVDQPIRVVQITSPLPQDGKTTTAANLASVMASTGKRVLLVDLDLRRPRLHSFFDLPNEIGFTSLLADDGPKKRMRAIVQIPDMPELFVLPSGPLPEQPSELLDSDAARTLITSLATEFDVLILDSPPVLGLSDALVISSHVDSTILVARGDTVHKRDLRKSVEVLTLVNAPLIGAVINIAGTRGSGYYGYGGHYYGDYYGKVYGQAKAT